jgi:hypothetical protein
VFFLAKNETFFEVPMAGNHRSGRRQKPIEQHIAAGTFRRDRHGRPERRNGDGADYLWVPTGFEDDPEAVELFELLSPGLPLEETDSPLFAAMIQTWGLYQNAYHRAKQNADDKSLRSAVVQYLSVFERLASRFGMSPTDRPKLRS